MHPSSLENMEWCYRRYAAPRLDKASAALTVLDVGGANHNGSYSDIFTQPAFQYLGMDITAGPGVDIVLQDPHHFPLEDASIDFVISGQMLEHCEFFWQVFAEMVRVVKPDGHIFLIAPSAGPIHRYPVDCYRYYPDAYRALAKLTGCHLVDLRQDNRGPWNDLVGVFAKTPQPAAAPHAAPVLAPPVLFNGSSQPEQEITRGQRPYLEVLAELHRVLQPRAYLEIGVRHGRSLQLAQCPALGVDPAPDVTAELPPSATVLRMTSDDFFEHENARLRSLAPDLVFIDGMHLFEFALRDLMHVEKLLGPETVVVIDDVFPNHPAQAQRNRATRVWTGDVWRVLTTLQEARPDLCLFALDTAPSGLLIIAGLNSKNQALWQQYNPLVRAAQSSQDGPPQAIVERIGALAPSGNSLQTIFSLLRDFRANIGKVNKAREVLRRGLNQLKGAAPTEAPRRLRLTVVLVCYNMAREIPRTVQSLAPSMQQGIAEHEYEILLIDNGSTKPFDAALCKQLAPNLKIIHVPDATVSPVRAVNLGLEQARGQLVGVFIDGARMASPGLLRAALDASLTHPRPVVGTLAFHLGPDVQNRSILEGYSQPVEDALLAESGWERNGYRLFDISVFAHSSSGGWFATPAECNALFMKPAQWAELGGFDARFVSAGGGLVNLDTWARACQLPNSQVIMVLGEGTFHQVHGGVATNATKPDTVRLFHDEYFALHRKKFSKPEISPKFYGSLKHLGNAKLQQSPSPAVVPKAAPAGQTTALSAQGRSFATAVPAPLLGSMQRGVMQSLYRGVPFLKSPFDIGIYLQLLSRLQPRTVIEIGTKHGGSALWFADMLSAAGVADPVVVSVDINPIAKFSDPRIRFLEGDASNLAASLPAALLQSLPRPWLVIEDSSHMYADTLSVLRFFDAWLRAGDWIAVEDGVVSHFADPVYQRYENGPNRAVRDFLQETADTYRIDASLCDFYGTNATYNPNGFLVRVKQ